MLLRPPGAQQDAASVPFDNTASGLAATDVQAAVDETEGRVDSLESAPPVHTHAEADITDLDHTDVDAIHDNVAGEITAITEKTAPVAADVILLEDSAAGNAKRRVQIGNLPFPAPLTVIATAPDPITSGTDILVDSLTRTPGAGNYLVSAGMTAILSANNSAADFSIYVNGSQVTGSVRPISRGGGSTAGITFPIGYEDFPITGVLAAEDVEIRASVSAGTVTVDERHLTLTPTL